MSTTRGTPFSTIANDVALDFTGSALTTRWLHGITVDEPLAFERYAGTTTPGAGAAHEMLADRLGSVLEVVGTATNTVTGSATFDAFGQRTVTGAAERYGFTGREHDAESGLIYFRARHYDPALGQFLQRDPIGFAAGDLNLYAYTWNDPFNWTDPSGLFSSAEYAQIGAVTSGLATVGCLADILCDLNGDGKTIAGTPSLNPVGQIMGGLGALISNAFAALNSAFDQWFNKNQSGRGDDLPVTDSTGKTHGDIPSPEELKQMPTDELKDYADELRDSVPERIDSTIEHGRDRPHGQRQGKEQDTIKTIEKIIKDRGGK